MAGEKGTGKVGKVGGGRRGREGEFENKGQEHTRYFTGPQWPGHSHVNGSDHVQPSGGSSQS